MTVIAQTNIQLFNQLALQRYAATDVALVRDAYILAMRLFSGQYRSSGKTFVAHAVGTASVLAGLRSPAHVVGAALLHSAYTLGEFGMLRRRIDERKRERVRSAIGPEGELLVDAYAALDWNEQYVRSQLRSSDKRTALERDVIMIRLANEVDDYADLAALYSANWKKRVDEVRAFLPCCAELADRLGAFELRDALRLAMAQTLAEPAPRAATTASAVSMLVPPASHAQRPHVIVRSLIDAVRARRSGPSVARPD